MATITWGDSISSASSITTMPQFRRRSKLARPSTSTTTCRSWPSRKGPRVFAKQAISTMPIAYRVAGRSCQIFVHSSSRCADYQRVRVGRSAYRRWHRHHNECEYVRSDQSSHSEERKHVNGGCASSTADPLHFPMKNREFFELLCLF